jgi:hypothetical protein
LMLPTAGVRSGFIQVLFLQLPLVIKCGSFM